MPFIYNNTVLIRDIFIKSNYTDEVKIAYGNGGAEWKSVRTKNNSRNPHLWSYSFNTLDCVANALKNNGVLAKKYSNFEEIYNDIETIIGKISGVGHVEIYDVALYIGTQKGIYPIDYVYVHGILIKATADFLGMKQSDIIKNGYKIEINKFRRFVTAFKPNIAARALEEFLCDAASIYKTKPVPCMNSWTIEY